MTAFRLATYANGVGPRAAICFEDRLFDAAEICGIASYQSVLGILEDWPQAEGIIERIAASPPSHGRSLADTPLLAPILYPGAIYCCGANYQDHMDNVAKFRGLNPQPNPRLLGLEPFHFLKAPRCVVGPEAKVRKDTPALDFEIELAVIIGRPACRVSTETALDHVAAYTVANDLSARDRVTRAKLPESSPFRYDWLAHKSFDGSCPLGPWLVPASAIRDPQNLTLKTIVNGRIRQDSTTNHMIYSVAEQISSLSRYCTLHPGDVILTGTPAGVGAESGEFLQRGDQVKVAIGGVGEITTHIV